MAISSIVTAIPLDQAARVLGLIPAHFNQCAGNTIWSICDKCSDIWYQKPWQAYNSLSRDAFAEQLLIAENEIGNLLRNPIVPRKMTKSIYLSYEQVEAINARSFAVYIGKHIHDISSLAAVGSATVSVGDGMEILDEDNDSIADMVEVSVVVPEGVLESDIRIYYAGHAGEDGYEIRDIVSRSLSEVNDEVICTLRLHPWQILTLDVLNRSPSGKCSLDVSNLSDTSIYCDELDVLLFSRIYQADGFSNVRITSSNLYDNTQVLISGYHVDVDGQHVIPIAANYTDGAWVNTSVVSSQATLSIDYWVGSSEMPPGVVEAAASIAMARMHLHDCDCECNDDKTWKRYGKDLGAVVEMSYRRDLSDCPFGMRLGEFEGWKRIRGLTTGGVVTGVSVY